MKFPTETILRLLVVKFAKSPMNTLGEIGRRFLPMGALSPQVQEMRDLTLNTPLIVQIETTNACNAHCAFCAYPRMKRKKGIMSLPLFEQIIGEYEAMGGGPVSLTPLVGDALLDPHLLERLRILENSPKISQVSLTTNAIALERYADDEVRRLLEAIDCVQISLGGLDPATYRDLFGVDKFAEAHQALERLLSMRDEVENPPILNLAFRTNDWKFELRHRKEINQYRQRGAFVSHLWTFANYAGLVQKDRDLEMEVSNGKMKKDMPCIYPAVHLAVCWDGRITACGCVDFECSELPIGRIGDTTLGQVWPSERRRQILDSFGKKELPPVCRECSAYKPDSAIFSSAFCTGIRSHAPLPPGYFQEFWGG